MKNIRITQGAVGVRVGLVIETKTADDGVFAVEDAVAARLLQRGVAEEATSNKQRATSHYSMDMKLAELKEIAAAYGVDAEKMKTKADVIAALDEATSGTEDEVCDDEEEQPDLT